MNQSDVPQSQPGDSSKRPLWSRLTDRDIKRPAWRLSKPAKARIDGDTFVEDEMEPEHTHPGATVEQTDESPIDPEGKL